MIVVRDSGTPEAGIACANRDFAEATEEQSVNVRGRGRSPGGVASSVRVAGVEEGVVAGLHLLDQRSLGCAGVGDSAELRMNASDRVVRILEKDAYHNLDIVLMADYTGFSAEGNSAVTRIACAHDILSRVYGSAVLSPRPGECPGRAPPHLISTHLLELRTSIGIWIAGVGGGDGVAGVSEELVRNGSAKHPVDVCTVVGWSHGAGCAPVDGISCFLMNGGDQERLVDGGEGSRRVQG